MPEEIERGFAWWNQKYWSSELMEPLFNIHPDAPNGHRFGHFWPNRWVPDDRRRNSPHEIVFYADACLKGGAPQIFETLVHEMVHLWQHQCAPETVGAFNWHTIEWHAEAKRVGLISKPGDGKGHTTAGPQFKRDLAVFAPKVARSPHRPRVGSKNKLAKWTCECGYGVRVAVHFDATCNACKTKFKPAPPRW